MLEIKNPLISIILPVFNVERYLPQCLNSLVNQTIREIEIICVNDGSSDNSLSILKEYAKNDNRIVVINQPNSGVSVARNNALKHVKGEYYMFVDSDDWLDPETCETSYSYARKYNADCLMFSYTKEFANHNIVNHVFHDDYFVWDKLTVVDKFHRRLFGPIGEELAIPQDVDIIVTPCMQLFKTEKFKNIPFVDIRDVGTFEDGLYQMVVYKDCNRFVYIDKPFYHYRKTNEDSITTKYKADLPEKFMNLFEIIDRFIVDFNLGSQYIEALNNRVAISVLGLGLNSIKAPNSLIYNIAGGGIYSLLNIKRIRESLSLLDISKMPLPWRLFFFLAKHRMTILLTLMLQLIEFTRTHRKTSLKENGNKKYKD